MFSKILFGQRATKEEIRSELKDADSTGSIYMGKTFIIRKVFLSTCYARLNDIKRAYMRVESGEYGDIQLDQYSVVLVFYDDSEGVLLCDNQKVAQRVLEWIANNRKEIFIGKK